MPDAGSETPNPGIKKKVQRKRILTALTAVFLFLGLIFLLYWLFVGRFYETTDDAYVNGNLIQVMPQISAPVTQILADETDFVKKGSVLIVLDKLDAEIALKKAETDLAVTVRQVSQLYHQVEQLQAKLKAQEELVQKAKNDYQRRQKLGVGEVITVEDLEHSKVTMSGAEDTLDLVQHQLDSALALVANSDLYHHPQIQQASVKLRDAYLALKRTTIYAPETGYVAKRPVQVGQEVTPNTILMIIVPLNQVWVEANFKEPQLRNFRIGQPVTSISDLYGSSVKYRGRVMGLNPGAGNAFDLLPPQNATGNWIKIVQRLPVRIQLDAQQLREHPLRLGLSMTVTVDTHDRKGASLSEKTGQKIIYQTTDYNVDELQKADQLINEILQQNAVNISKPAAVSAQGSAAPENVVK